MDVIAPNANAGIAFSNTPLPAKHLPKAQRLGRCFVRVGIETNGARCVHVALLGESACYNSPEHNEHYHEVLACLRNSR